MMDVVIILSEREYPIKCNKVSTIKEIIKTVKKEYCDEVQHKNISLKLTRFGDKLDHRLTLGNLEPLTSTTTTANNNVVFYAEIDRCEEKSRCVVQ
tara:strand:+ start:382 stop:669 length:288 start_codon:yes stop_codon:yes gene_type:complete